jgi:hypothetical protein
LYVYFEWVETKGLTLEEIEAKFDEHLNFDTSRADGLILGEPLGKDLTHVSVNSALLPDADGKKDGSAY